MPLDRDLILAAIHPRPGRFRDLDPRLARAHLQRDHVGGVNPRALRIEVAPPQLLIARHATIQNPAVERRDEIDVTRPILGHQLPLQRRKVHPAHADEAPAPQTRLPTSPISETELPGQHRVAHVVSVPIGQ